MAQSLIKKQSICKTQKTLKTALLSTAICIILSGCDNDRVTHVNTAFDKNWEQIAQSQGILKDEQSHLERLTTPPETPEETIDDSQMMRDAPTPVVEMERPDIIPQSVETPVRMAQNESAFSPAPVIVDEPPRFEPPIRNSGLNPKNMFGTELGSEQERLDRLERAVQDMRNDFSRVEPSIRRLMALETDIQSLIRELEQLNNDATPQRSQRRNVRSNTRTNVADDIIQNDGTQRMAAAAPAPEPAATATRPTSSSNKGFVKKSAPPLSNQPVIYDIRVGEHPDKTRIVMDVNSKTNFSVDIDNNEQILLIDLPNAGWDARMAQNFAKSPNIKSFSVNPSGDGHLAVFQLKREARVAYQGDLKGFEGSSRRLVIDVTAQ